jgi:hypothetical protein
MLEVICASVHSGYGTPSWRCTAILRGIVLTSSVLARSHGKFGMFEPVEIDLGFSMWRRCQTFGYFPPTRARSGPLRFEPHWKGWS